ncbi:hypothetical protein K388_00306 [Streptomyces sp. KhCrAH-43]|uniref:hypothetical protein n=1 Tax=unclassified Streptomyces TaxID=2593676 RepID=UPI000DB9179C|nr:MULTISPECIES: hypothetical protein [unclassified Streptomyces]MYS37896.1 hypothetical protein [Streptomyces sp. SID4920]MYX66084.1 hypothetical protein [Streptomyces sp. SID8373]RAJ67566.1 hypothetical protein K388_00306 [Streptomyces sp. KhCrAH-43]
MPDLSGPVHLTDPAVLLEPVPVDGCDVCASLTKQRDEARQAGDGSTVSDCNVELGRHPHGKRGRR